MTVNELIFYLAACDPEAIVVSFNNLAKTPGEMWQEVYNPSEILDLDGHESAPTGNMPKTRKRVPPGKKIVRL